MNILCKHNLLVTVFFYIIFIFFIQLNANESSDTDTSVIVNKTNVLAIKNLPNKEDLITKNIAKDKEISTILSDKDIADKINQINNRIEIDENILANVLSAISAQFATASYVLGIVGLIFVILSIFLGIYINYISKKIALMRDESKDLLSASNKIKNDIKDLNDLINSNLDKVFS